MLTHRKLLIFLWEDTLQHAAYIWNQVPTRALLGKTPHKMWMGWKPDVLHLREFSCPVWVYDEHQMDKLHPHSSPFVFMGFQDESNSIHFYDAAMRCIRALRNFHFQNDIQHFQDILVPLLLEGEPMGVIEPQSDKTSPSATPKPPSAFDRSLRMQKTDLDY